ncbi:hypothetical protein KC353_g2002 [Hortaea werneckii]|uniref:RRM domain-containing protein n=1 Tax=Hortaea werneckii TaxID=91943 RepID=A0A3M7DDV3_HORWE|nr:hypothetical protein KC353_g2002 [Hortaea werneckii]RMY62518.1 hypothetical protein D0865_00374 [Hortaea werneckii]
MAASDRAPFPTNPEDFDTDERISFSKASETYLLEDENGDEWEWVARQSKWVPAMDEALMEQQRQAYKVEGVDESEPAVDLRKRKAEGQDGSSNGKANKKQKPEQQQPRERVNTAVYVTSLPQDVDTQELHDVFSKFGVIAESLDSSEPRIKLYYNDDSSFKGDALIVYFRPESVQLAINMLDETDFRLGQQLPTGPMRVREAEASYKAQKEQPLATEQAKKKGTGANRDRQKVIRKTQEMNNRLADWDDDDPQSIPDTSSRWDKVVVLKHMFTLDELAEDAAAALDIKDDIREECEKLGHVTNVVLYDKEESGIVTVRFGNATSAMECVKVFNGRWFDQRQVVAHLADGKERFRKSKKGEMGTEDDEEKRLEQFSKDIEG